MFVLVFVGVGVFRCSFRFQFQLSFVRAVVEGLVLVLEPAHTPEHPDLSPMALDVGVAAAKNAVDEGSEPPTVVVVGAEGREGVHQGYGEGKRNGCFKSVAVLAQSLEYVAEEDG